MNRRELLGLGAGIFGGAAAFTSHATFPPQRIAEDVPLGDVTARPDPCRRHDTGQSRWPSCSRAASRSRICSDRGRVSECQAAERDVGAIPAVHRRRVCREPIISRRR